MTVGVAAAVFGDVAPDRPELRLAAAVRQIVAGDAFQGVPLARVLGAALTPRYWADGFTIRAPRPTAGLARRVYYLWLRERALAVRGRPRRRRISLPEGRVAIEVVSVEPRSRNLWEPVARQLGRERTVLVLAHRHLRASLSPDYPAIAMDEMPIDWPACRAWLRPRLPRWEAALADVRREFDLAPGAEVEIGNTLIVQAMRIAEVLALGRALAPRSFLTLWDHGPFGAPLCASLRALGVPTHTVVHGAVGRQSMMDFTPLNADRVLVWGEVQRRLFVDAGVAPSRIVVVGCQRLRMAHETELHGGERAALLRRFGLQASGPVVVVGFTVLDANRRLAWACAVREMHDALPEAVLLCRLHPSEKPASYAHLLVQGPRLAVIGGDALALEATLALADAVVVDSSTLGFDAVVHRRVVAVFDPYPTPKAQGVMPEVVAAGAALYARSPAELAQALRSVWGDAAAGAALRVRGDMFVRKYVAAFGDEAAQRVARELWDGGLSE